MTKQRYVTDLREGMTLTGELFLLLEKSVSVTRKGSPYLAFTVGDRTGRIDARYWNVPQDLPGRLTVGEGLRVDATVTSWKGTLQLTVTGLTPCPAEPLEELVLTGSVNRGKLVAELREVIAGVGERFLRELLEQILLDPDFLPRYATAPAAKRNHHAWQSGLLAHSLAVAQAALDVSRRYHHVDRHLLVTAALLHDVGKVVEYTSQPAIDFTDEGKLVGHIVIGARNRSRKPAMAPAVSPSRRQRRSKRGHWRTSAPARTWYSTVRRRRNPLIPSILPHLCPSTLNLSG
jgi:3'-5' exoribonuclease